MDTRLLTESLEAISNISLDELAEIQVRKFNIEDGADVPLYPENIRETMAKCRACFEPFNGIQPPEIMSILMKAMPDKPKILGSETLTKISLLIEYIQETEAQDASYLATLKDGINNTMLDCDVIAVKMPPTLFNLDELPIASKFAFVRANDQYYYVDKVKFEVNPIRLSDEQIKILDRELNPSDQSRTLTDTEKNKITDITNKPTNMIDAGVQDANKIKMRGDVDATIFKMSQETIEKKIQLEMACQKYAKYLEKAILQHVKKSKIVEKSPLSSDHLEKLMHSKDCPHSIQLAIQKYQAVNELHQSLNQTNRTIPQKLDRFMGLFKKHKTLIETHRDTAAKIFLKSVATVASLGIAAPFLWRRKGEKISKKVDRLLNEYGKNVEETARSHKTSKHG